MKKGDIVFCQGKGLMGSLIRFFDKGKWSHVAIAISNRYVLESDYDTSVAILPFDRSEYSKIEVFDLGLTMKQRERVGRIGAGLVGRRYDYPQILWYAISKIFGIKGRNRLNHPDYYICSELVYFVLREAGILKELGIEDIRGTDLTPNQLYDLVKYVSKK